MFNASKKSAALSGWDHFQEGRIAPPLRRLAGQLLAFGIKEAKPGLPPAGTAPALFLVCEKLRPHLAALMGAAGFRALLARALVLAAAEAPWLGGVRVTLGGALEGLDGAAAPVSAKVFARGGVELIAQLLGLLATFIGEDLTLRLVREVWPAATLGDRFLQNGANNEKTN